MKIRKLAIVAITICAALLFSCEDKDMEDIKIEDQNMDVVNPFGWPMAIQKDLLGLLTF